jgi:branched-chain amino acid transport system substrate-binding protein
MFSRSMLASVLAGALSFGGAAKCNAADLTIGLIGTLSGPATEWGLALQRGVDIAIDEVNAAGGLKVGSETYTVKRLMYDDQGSGQGGTTAATRMINADGIKFIIGSIGSGPTLGVLGVSRPAKAIVLSNGFAPEIMTPESKYNFRVALTAAEFAPGVVEWLGRTHPKERRVGIISPNDAVGASVTPLQIDAYKKGGFDIVFSEKFERGMTDFTPLLTRMLASNVDVFELDGNSPGDAGLLVKQVRQLGYRGVVIQIAGPTIDQIMKIAGPLAEGVLTYDIFDPLAPDAQAFVKAFRAKVAQGPINAYSPIMYNGAKLLFEAMRRAGSFDVDKVRDELERLSGYETLFGKVRWTGEKTYGINHQLLTDFFVSEVKNGQLVIVERLKP